MRGETTPRDLEDQLVQGLDLLGLRLDAKKHASLLAFLALLRKWNQTYNLTSVRDPGAMVTHHLLDSLTLLPYLRGERLIDVGTGAGLPGMVLALAEPERRWVLLDSNLKKTRFLTQAVMELKLANVEVVRARAEDFRPSEGFHTVVVRAVGTIGDVARMTQHLCSEGGKILLMKGVYPTGELTEVPDSLRIAGVHPLEVPGLVAERHVVVLEVLPRSENAAR
jgi:16S rRNA (guanine527-N7)-methyltransferase